MYGDMESMSSKINTRWLSAKNWVTGLFSMPRSQKSSHLEAGVKLDQAWSDQDAAAVEEGSQSPSATSDTPAGVKTFVARDFLAEPPRTQTEVGEHLRQMFEQPNGPVMFSDDAQKQWTGQSEDTTLEAGRVTEMYHAGTRRFYQVAVKGALTRELDESEDPAARSITWLTDALHRAEDRARTMEEGYTTATQLLFKHTRAGMETSNAQMPLEAEVSATANVVQADLWLNWRDEQIALVESLRREKFDPALNPRPINNVVDYAAAAQAIQLAMQALDESLPSGQRARSEQALKLAAEGLKMLRAWCAVKGYSV